MVKKFASLLLSCIYLVSNSNSMDNLNSINDLSNINYNINTNLMSNVKLNNTLSLKKEASQNTNQETAWSDAEYNISQDKNNINQKNSNEEYKNSDDIKDNIIEENNTISNTIEQNTTKKKKKKKHRKKKNKNKNNINQNSINENNKNNIKEDENIYECNEKKSLDDPFLQSIKNKLNINENTVQDAKDCLTKEFQYISEKNKQAGVEDVDQTIQDVFNIDIVKSTIDAMNNDINKQIHSEKFKMLGNLHKQIMSNLDNGNTVYNRFNIDANTLDKYKQYYKQLLICTNDFCNKKLMVELKKYKI